MIPTLNLVSATRSNGGVFLHADAVAAGLVDGRVEVAAEGFAGALGDWLGLWKGEGAVGGKRTWTIPTPFLRASLMPLLEWVLDMLGGVGLVVGCQRMIVELLMWRRCYSAWEILCRGVVQCVAEDGSQYIQHIRD